MAVLQRDREVPFLLSGPEVALGFAVMPATMYRRLLESS
jgi:hypothetical protein